MCPLLLEFADISPWTGDDYIITGNFGRLMCPWVTAEYGTGGRFGWQSAWSNYAFMIILSHASKKGTSRDGEFPT